MRILLVTGTYLPSANGVAVSVSGLKSLFTSQGHEVLVVAPKYRGAEDEKGVARYPSIENPLISDYPIPLFPGRAIFKQIARFKPDIVHVHHAFHIGYFARLMAEKYKIPVVFTFHTDVDRYAQKYANLLPKVLRKWFLENTIYDFSKKVDLLIAPSKFIEKRLQQKMPFVDVVTIPSPVMGIKKILLTKDEIKEKLKLPKDKKILLTVSRLGTEKNLKVLIQSIKFLPKKYLLVLVGSGPHEGYLKNLAKKVGVEHQVLFVGKVSHSQIGEYYKVVDYFYYSSTTETQGLVFLEAASFAKPIIAVDSFAARELLNDSFSQITNNSPRGLAQGVGDIEKRENDEMARNALKLASKYSQTVLAKKFLINYKNLITRENLANKMLATGWQSWSYTEKRLPWRLKRDFNPLVKEFIPHEILTKPTGRKAPIRGWCSWYAFGGAITHNKILTQAQWFNKHPEVPVEYILIDEGWCKWGDWDKSKKGKFPFGMKALSDSIRNLGLKPGIWIAPFLVERDSDVFRSKGDWLVRKNGVLVNGINWTVFDRFYFERYLLDIRKDEVKTYILNTLDSLVDRYGFDLIKLDFLYAAYFIPGITANEAGGFIREIFTHLRTRYPKVYTIACGAPLTPISGVADSVRIGPDTFTPMLDGKPIVSKLFHEWRVDKVISNINKRNWTKAYWNLDPDAFVCRPSIGLSDFKLGRLQKSIIEGSGNIFLGDDMPKLAPKRIEKYILPLFKVR